MKITGLNISATSVAVKYKDGSREIINADGYAAMQNVRNAPGWQLPPKVEPPPEPTQPERGKSLRRPAEGW